MPEVAAILLAAGRSRRMGAFKPLLPFGDSTVIETCVKSFLLAGVKEIVVVTGHRGDDLREQLKDYQISFAENPDPDSEMSVSIAKGVARVGLNARAVLITPADYPAVPAEIIELLIDEWQRPGSRLIQPEHAGRGGHPVLVDLCYRDELMELDPQSGLRSLFDRNRAEVRRVPVSSPFVARDMDTWDDYCDLHFTVFGRKPRQTESGGAV